MDMAELCQSIWTATVWLAPKWPGTSFTMDSWAQNLYLMKMFLDFFMILIIIPDKKWTYHNSSAVVAYAKLWLDLTIIFHIRAVFPLTHNKCEVVISWWSPLLPKISIYATKCESILEKSGIFIHLQSKYCINLSCKKNLTISWVQIAARW